jgi:hypothetical protein
MSNFGKTKQMRMYRYKLIVCGSDMTRSLHVCLHAAIGLINVHGSKLCFFNKVDRLGSKEPSPVTHRLCAHASIVIVHLHGPLQLHILANIRVKNYHYILI